MSLTSDLIKSRIVGDVEPADLGLAVGLIHDSLAPGAGIDAIEAAITKARSAYGSSLFRVAPIQATTQTAQPVGTLAQQQRQQRTADALDAALARCNGNPYRAKNLTVAALLEARDPERAARLRSEAGT